MSETQPAKSQPARASQEVTGRARASQEVTGRARASHSQPAASHNSRLEKEGTAQVNYVVYVVVFVKKK